MFTAAILSLSGCSLFSSGPARETLLAPRQHGLASFYGDEFVGKRTASGEIYRHEALTAAHPALPFGTLVRVTNVLHKTTVIFRIKDREQY